MKIFEDLKKKINDVIKLRWFRFVMMPLARRDFRNVCIMDSMESIRFIKEHKCSVSRFGDGEFFIMMGKEMGFQEADELLSERLRQILVSNDAPNHFIGLPIPLKNISKLRLSSKDFWGFFVLRYADELLPLISLNKVYLDTQLSRFYIIYKDKSHCEEQLRLLKGIWEHQDVVIIEGDKSRTGVGNDLYSNARSIKRILGPSENAFRKYSQMLDAIKLYVPKNKLILLSYGMTATVLAYDLAKLGYWAIDIGHLDIEYEWFRLNVSDNVKIFGKYTNECEGGGDVEELTPRDYMSQILLDISKDEE